MKVGGCVLPRGIFLEYGGNGRVLQAERGRWLGPKVMHLERLRFDAVHIRTLSVWLAMHGHHQFHNLVSLQFVFQQRAIIFNIKDE